VGGGNGLAGGVRRLGGYGKRANCDWLGQGFWWDMPGGGRAKFGAGVELGMEDDGSLGGTQAGEHRVGYGQG